MIFIDKMKNFKIYKTQMFLPTMEKDKKKKSSILLMTPNYQSSKKLLSYPLFVNKLRFESYYIDRDVAYYINSKNAKEVNSLAENYIEKASELSYYQNLLEMTRAERDKLNDSQFGIPSKRKYPLDSPTHVKSAIKFFNYCSKEDEELLAKNIIKAIKKFDIDVKVGDKNRLSKYYSNTNESAVLIENVLESAEDNMVRPSNLTFEGPSEDCNYLRSFLTVENYTKILEFCGVDITDKSRIPYIKVSIGSEDYYNIIASTTQNTIINLTVKPKKLMTLNKYKEYVLCKIIKCIKISITGDDSIDEDDFIKFCNDNTVCEELEEADVSGLFESKLDSIYLTNNIDGINTGDKLILFKESKSNDIKLRQLLYNDRMKKRQELLVLYDHVKADFPWIKYTYPDLNRYTKKNLFVDLYYYTDIFFKNNNWTLTKGFNLYLDFVDRLINNPSLEKAGYEKKTIFIPVLDWDVNHNGTIWNFRKSLNPLSIIYQLMYQKSNKLVEVFGDTNLILIGSNKYFKINFKELSDQGLDLKKLSVKLKMFLIKLCKDEEFDSEDVDTTADNTESPEVIRANIADKIELSKGVDLTPRFNKAEETPTEDKDKTVSKLTKDTPTQKSSNSTQNDLDKLANAVDTVSKNSKSEDDALDMMDNSEIKQILVDLDSKSNIGNAEIVNPARAARINQLDQELLQKEIKGKSIKDILSDKNKNEKITTNVDVASPNEEWHNLTFMNFDKNYDIDKDIVSCFKYFDKVSRPISIRNIEVTNNSTSEDRLELYKVEMEDYRGKRMTIKLDIPIMVDNRFLLRGNSKSIQTQFTNMPIIKTEVDTCQIISNYMKVFVYRFGNTAGKSLPITGKFIKAVKKYSGSKIKFSFGDNTKICSKYGLPIDYIDIASVLNSIDTKDYKILFNQDIIEQNYKVDRSKGIPYGINKKTKEILYYNSPDSTFVEELLYLIDDDKLMEEFDRATKPSSPSYSRCSIMSTKIPTVVICGYHVGLRKTLDKAKIDYRLSLTLDKETRHNLKYDWIKFSDGYLIYECNYESSLLLSGLKICDTESFELSDIDNKNMYLEFLDQFGGRIKADGLDNFYDLMVDPMTEEILRYYKLPTDYISILLYANMLLADNKFIKHTNTISRRVRRYELIAVYTYKVLADAYASYANQLKHSREAAEFSVKQSAVIDRLLTDTISSDDSCINALRDVETTNAVTTKGPSGMNTERAYSLDKRTYDESMLNILGMSTGFAGNVGITRQATINANVDTDRGYVKSIDGDTSKMNTASTLTATEALVPFGTTHDDPMRTAMTFIQTAKHAVRTEDSDPLLVTNGYDEVLPYDTTNKFAFKAKYDGKIEELTDDHILVSYKNGEKDYINLVETIEKNSDGGYYVPLKLDVMDKLKVGNRIKQGQILAYDKYSFSNSVGETDNIAYNVGKLAKVAIINTDEGYEDSGIITEKMAEKLATRIDLKYDKVLDKESEIYHFAKIGDHVECGDPLMIWQSPFEDEDANSLLKTLAGDEVSELGKRTLKSEVTGVVKGIKIYRTIELDDMSESLRKIVSNYEKPYNQMEKIYKKNNLDISQIPAHYPLEPTGKLKKAQDAVLIEFYVEYKDTVGIGDKVVYFAANKAVEKNIIPKGLEPYTDFRPNEKIDAFVSEVSIDKRIVTSSLFMGSLQKLMIELDRSVKDIMGIEYDDSEV